MGVLDNQRAGITTALNTVANIGVVKDHQPAPPTDWGKYVAAFKATIAGESRVRVWWVNYLGENREKRTIAIGSTKVKRRTRWLIRGFDSWDDPTSDAVFGSLVEDVVQALDTATSLSGSALVSAVTQVELPNQGQGLVLGDILCHSVNITVEAVAEDTLATA